MYFVGESCQGLLRREVVCVDVVTPAEVAGDQYLCLFWCPMLLQFVEYAFACLNPEIVTLVLRVSGVAAHVVLPDCDLPACVKHLGNLW